MTRLGFLLLLMIGGAAYLLLSQNTQKKMSFDAVAVVDWENVTENLENMQAFKTRLKKKFEAYHNDFQKKEAELRAEYQDLVGAEKINPTGDRDKTLMLEKKRDQFNKDVLEVQQKAENRQKELNDFYVKSLEEFNAFSKKKISDFCKRHKIKLLLSKDRSFYVDASRDVTKNLIQELAAFHFSDDRYGEG